jgi:signal transduction histidine kinase
VVKRIVDGHNGDISLTTEVGRGTTFEVSLPLDAA